MQETWVLSLGWEEPPEEEIIPTPVSWPGESHGLYSPWGRKESDMTKRLSLSLHFHFATCLLCDTREVASCLHPQLSSSRENNSLPLYHATLGENQVVASSVFPSMAVQQPVVILVLWPEKMSTRPSTLPS